MKEMQSGEAKKGTRDYLISAHEHQNLIMWRIFYILEVKIIITYL